MKTAEIAPGKVYAVQRGNDVGMGASAVLILSTETHCTGGRYRSGPAISPGKSGSTTATNGLPGVYLDRNYGSAEVPAIPAFTEAEIASGLETGRIVRDGVEYRLLVVPARQIHGEFGPVMERLLAERKAEKERNQAEEVRKQAARARQHAAIDQARVLLPEAFPTPTGDYDSLKDSYGSGSQVKISTEQFEALVALAAKAAR